MHFQPLTREELRAVIEGRGAAGRVPMMLHFWTSPERFGPDEGRVERLLATYPNDVQVVGLRFPEVFDAPADDPEYRWVNFDDPKADETVGIDAKSAITDWALLDGILRDFPNPDYPGMIPPRPADDGRYRLGTWWYCLFERFWSMRGMTNALMDFYTDPESVHRLFRALTDFYKRAMVRAKAELDLDGIFTSDDIGTQTGPFFSPALFREFFLPYYKELFDCAHSLGMHFWLHCCGNIVPFLPDFIDAGLDVLHPIQKYTMDERVIAEKYGDKLCIWAGFDVQQTIPWGTPDDVRREVRFLIDTYFRADGRLMLTAGNAITSDCPADSMEALLNEAYHYGTRKAAAARAAQG